MNADFDFKTIVVVALLAYAAWLLSSLPVQIKAQLRKLTVFRQALESQVSGVISCSLKTAPRAGLKEIYKSETLEYAGKTVSAINWRVIFRNDGNQFWLHTFYSDDRPHTDELVSELRARRTLFLHPREYEIAFGAYPHRDQLKPFMENSMKSKLERFNPDSHSDEIFVTEPIGQEFGAKFK